jgi:hypothetical protein
MAASQVPILRKNFNPPVGQPVAIAPAPGFPGCVLVEAVNGNDGQPALRISLYVKARFNGAATFIPVSLNDFWIVDLPDGIDLDLGQIRVAIANGAPNLPPGPPDWG